MAADSREWQANSWLRWGKMVSFNWNNTKRTKERSVRTWLVE